MIQAVVLLVGAIVGVSVAVGTLLACAMLIWAQDMPAAVRMISNGYYALVGLLPIALWWALGATRDADEYADAYASPFRGVLTAVQGAVIGSVLGAGPIFLMIFAYLPVILLDLEVGEFRAAVRAEIVWSRLLLVVIATVLSAVPLGFWVHYTGSRLDDN